MVHPDRHGAVRRNVTRAARPALAPLRIASRHVLGRSLPTGDDAASDGGEPRTGDGELAELTAMRAAGDGEPDDRARRATRSATAYLEARRERLRSELREQS